jgi:hypothetical protein
VAQLVAGHARVAFDPVGEADLHLMLTARIAQSEPAGVASEREGDAFDHVVIGRDFEGPPGDTLGDRRIRPREGRQQAEVCGTVLQRRERGVVDRDVFVRSFG